MFSAQTLRQILIAAGLTICSISDGFIFGQMSGMIDALDSKDASVSITSEDLSWMASTINILSIVGFAFMATITDFFGRRRAITIVCVPVTICWVLIYYAQEKVLLLISRIILGVCFGGIIMLVYMGIAEYQDVKIRALSLNLIVGVGTLFGTSLGHVMSVIVNWRYVALFGVIPSGLAAILPFFWVESPAWLAMKGRYEEAEKAFRAIHPSNEATERELRFLISYEKEKNNELSMRTNKTRLGLKIMLSVKRKYFWKILFSCIIVYLYRVASGRILFSTLAITILHDITGTSDILVFTLITDGFSIIGGILSCFILNKINNRKLFFISGLLGNFCLVMFGLCLYLFPANDLYLSWIKVSLITAYFIILTVPYVLLDTFLCVIIPVEIKSFLVTILCSVAGILQFLSIKFVPNMLEVMGYHGIFLFNAGITLLCILYLWFFMPETEGKSLQEIEYSFKNNTFNNKKELLSSEQSDDLLNKL